MNDAQKLDWNDLHVQHGLDVVREQLMAAAANEPMVRLAGLPDAPEPDASLPSAPSTEDPAADAASPTEGAGESGWTLDKVKARFALVEGETKVFDLHRKAIIKKTAFLAMTGKVIGNAWFDLPSKKGIDGEHAKRLETDAKLGARLRRSANGTEGADPFWRYVLLDGTQDIYDRYLRQRLPAGAVKLALGDGFSLWQNSDQRRSIPSANLVFDPCMTEPPADVINTYDGLPLTPSTDLERCQGIIWMVNFLCNGQQDAIQWLTRWLAYPLQKVGAKMDTAVLMHSTMEGSGKSLLFGDIMRPIYGEYGATVGQVQLESAWSQWQSNKLYGLFEEVVSRDQRYNQTGKIKHMITGKSVRIESKFMNGWEEANYMNAVFLSNEILPWPIGENDRRMLVLWPELTLPVKAQKRIGWELANGGIEAFYQYLLDYDLGDFNERTRPPHTPARQRLVELSRAAWETFYYQWQKGELGVPFTLCRTQDVHGLYLEWCARGKEHGLSETKLSLFLSTKPDTFKSSGQIFWTDDFKNRRRSIFFVPKGTPLELNISSAADVGRAVRDWRIAAWKAGWSPEKWENCLGFSAPMAAERSSSDA
ncbi:putative DNA primase/helicase [Halopseudomonas litoralis]|uniref:Putative DNA primase/helicase n=1 Tax=Halopseudomonas litoralis TaxID=797277 RepID=A0A1H1NVH5_9GAMM|nr:primase-helicase family protein [Halopseudomonas litoralis]SDS02775.1 putative DNA primase/helicase [Halopseudomonas litoralis]